MQKDKPRITEARITELPKGYFDAMPEVWVKYDGNQPETMLFAYYPDEISFHWQEFIGLTEDQAHELRRKKDINYLRS